MNTRLTLILAAGIAVAAVGTTTMMTTTVEAKGLPEGRPYGDLVSDEAERDNNNTDKGFGYDIDDFCDNGICGDNDQHLGNFRASDEADRSPGKSGNNRDENAGNPDS